MKKITLVILQIFSLAGFAQHKGVSNNGKFEQFAQAEMKSTLRVAAFTANAHTGNYDLGHITLQLTVNPASSFINGTVMATFTAKQDMSSIVFDLSDQMSVNSVVKDNTSLDFDQLGTGELVITLPATLPAGQQGTVVINYSGSPDQSNGYFTTTSHNGVPVLWTLSEPYGAMEWWPCKQDLNDKIDGLDVYITAPSQYTAVSNGLEQAQSISGSSKTTHFYHSYPIPAYLVAIAVTNYNVYTQTYNGALGSFPIVNYMYPETQSAYQPDLAQTLDIMRFYEDTFEQYPFHNEKYGHAQWNWGGGMEHSTVSFMVSFDRELVAHELAHQWFGDKITCGSWQDIWLNEGFATYLTGLVVEHQDGDNSFTGWKQQNIASITSSPGGAVYIPAADTISDDRIFSSRLSYNKGAMVLHMLRFKMGNTAFYQGVKNYLADNNLAYAYAKTPHLQQHLEQVYGSSLQEFFNDWVYNQGYPSYTVTVTKTTQGAVTVKLVQTQSHASVNFFEMPVPVRLTGANGQTLDVVLDNTFNNQTFTVPVTFNVTDAEVNAGYDIITGNNAVTLSTPCVTSNPEFVLYPNPAVNMLNVQVPNGIEITHAIIYNMLGQKVLETSGSSAFNVSALSAGAHILKLQTTQGSEQMRFIKQ
ncbi:MAG: M1 family aminopeptidase [Bacteroidia bacterium]